MTASTSAVLPRPWNDTPSRRERAMRAALFVLVAALHVLVLRWPVARPDAPQPAARGDLRMRGRLIPVLPPTGAPHREPAARPPLPPTPQDASSRTPARGPRGRERPVFPAAGASAMPATPTPAVEPATAPGDAAAGTAPLQLGLPPTFSGVGAPLRSRALEDPRTGPRRTASERFADHVGGSEARVEEATTAGRRFRQGTRCWEARPSRAAGLDRFNESGTAPQQVESCR
ncbi:hypothetical protein [Caldimonas tepidiphila]|uniref:hypothetical protein n=1 Tax=Caldimonas tepidiphila TaxID=2315841 RepID=UPI000E5A6D8F|nr:hypothetical protein [Caldimonas tepidiphila]